MGVEDAAQLLRTQAGTLELREVLRDLRIVREVREQEQRPRRPALCLLHLALDGFTELRGGRPGRDLIRPDPGYEHERGTPEADLSRREDEPSWHHRPQALVRPAGPLRLLEPGFEREQPDAEPLELKPAELVETICRVARACTSASHGRSRALYTIPLRTA